MTPDFFPSGHEVAQQALRTVHCRLCGTGQRRIRSRFRAAPYLRPSPPYPVRAGGMSMINGGVLRLVLAITVDAARTRRPGPAKDVQSRHGGDLAAVGTQRHDHGTVVGAPTPFAHFMQTAGAYGLGAAREMRWRPQALVRRTKGGRAYVAMRGASVHHGDGELDHGRVPHSPRNPHAIPGDSRRRSRRHGCRLPRFFSDQKNALQNIKSMNSCGL